MYREAGGIPVRPRVVAFLNDSAAPLLKGSYDDGTGRQLYRAVGGLTALVRAVGAGEPGARRAG
jgi:hypothetical protein